jgi:Zn-dependent M16 (insulinase) family peptidase
VGFSLLIHLPRRLRDLLSRGVFDIERLSVVSAKLLQDLPRRKRSANNAGSSTIFDMLFDKTKSPSIANGLLGTLNSLPSIAEELKQHPQQVIKKLETLREHLLDPAIMRISVAGDVLSIEKPRSAFSENFLPFNVRCGFVISGGPLLTLYTTANWFATPEDCSRCHDSFRFGTSQKGKSFLSGN